MLVDAACEGEKGEEEEGDKRYVYMVDKRMNSKKNILFNT